MATKIGSAYLDVTATTTTAKRDLQSFVGTARALLAPLTRPVVVKIDTQQARSDARTLTQEIRSTPAKLAVTLDVT